jgi:hypothetical protein
MRYVAETIVFRSYRAVDFRFPATNISSSGFF